MLNPSSRYLLIWLAPFRPWATCCLASLRCGMYIEPGQQIDHYAEGQANHVQVTAIDALGRLKVWMLNAIASCFVQWVPCSNVGRYVLFGVGTHQYRSCATGALYLKLVIHAPAHADSGHYTVPAIA